MSTNMQLSPDLLEALAPVSQALGEPVEATVVRAVRFFLAQQGDQIQAEAAGLAEFDGGESHDFDEVMAEGEQIIADAERCRAGGGLLIPATDAQRLERLTMAAGMSPGEFLRQAAFAVADFEARLVQTGLPGLRHWTGGHQGKTDPFGTSPLDVEIVVDLGKREAGVASVAVATGRTVLSLLGALATAISRTDEMRVRSWLEEEQHEPGALHDILIATALDAVTGTIKNNGFLWPAETPFPWSDTDCAAILRGYKVRWPGSMVDFHERLPGRLEMTTWCFAYLYQP